MWRRTDVTKVIVAFRNFANAPKNEGVYRLCGSQDLYVVPVEYCLIVRQVARSYIREGLIFLTAALIRAEDSDTSWFSCRVPPAEQLSLRLTAAAFAVRIPHESKMNERMNLSHNLSQRPYLLLYSGPLTFPNVTLVFDAHLGSISPRLSLTSVCWTFRKSTKQGRERSYKQSVMYVVNLFEGGSPNCVWVSNKLFRMPMGILKNKL
jgi:hypothetical protein